MPFIVGAAAAMAGLAISAAVFAVKAEQAPGVLLTAAGNRSADATGEPHWYDRDRPDPSQGRPSIFRGWPWIDSDDNPSETPTTKSSTTTKYTTTATATGTTTTSSGTTHTTPPRSSPPPPLPTPSA